MIIGSLTENQNIEKRIAITPDIAKKYISLGLEVILPENYGSHLGIKDEEFKELGVIILKDDKEIKNMKIKSSLKSVKKRDLNSKLVRRRGRIYVINKTNPKVKARQK